MINKTIFRAKDLSKDMIQENECAWETKKFHFMIILNGEYDHWNMLQRSIEKARECLNKIIGEISEEAIEGVSAKYNGKEITLSEGIELAKSLAKKNRFVLVDIIYNSNADSSFKLRFYKSTTKDKPEILYFSFWAIGGY